MSKNIILNYVIGTQGTPWSAWRHRNNNVQAVADLEYYEKQAVIAEQGCFDAIFWVDHLGLFPSEDAALFWVHDPLLLLSALAARTRHIGLIATVGTSYSQPYAVARAFASLDHLSKGRAGWNVVTSASEIAARNHGDIGPKPDADRYRRANEFLAAAIQLWHAWEDDTVKADRLSGQLVDPGKISAINFTGEELRVHGPLSTMRTPQTVPVICQAGPSPSGRRLAAIYADLVYAHFGSMEASRDYRDDLRRQASAAGRSADAIRLVPNLTPFIKSTEAEARRFCREMLDLSDPARALSTIAEALAIDLCQQDFEARIPPEYLDRVPRCWPRIDGPTLREWQRDGRHATWGDLARLVEAQRAGDIVIGTPEKIAGLIIDGFHSGAFDGVSISAPLIPHSLSEFVEHVIPILQDKRVHKRSYAPGTLRDRLGLPVSQSVDRTAWTPYYKNAEL